MKKFLKITAVIFSAAFLFGCGEEKTQEVSENIASEEQQNVQAEDDSYVENPDDIKIIIDGKRLKTNYPPEFKNGETMVPFRDIFNAFGFSDNEITWDEKTRMIRAEHNDNVIILYIDMTTASGGGKSIELKTPPYVNEQGVTMVPLNFIAKAMSADIEWNAEEKTNTITTR